MTVIYVTARTMDSQMAAKEQLDLCRKITDNTLEYLKYWPGLNRDGHMYQSPYLFSAVLDHHRSMVKVASLFCCCIKQNQRKTLAKKNCVDFNSKRVTRQSVPLLTF